MVVWYARGHRQAITAGRTDQDTIKGSTNGMKPIWTYSDIFDLEYFFHRDQGVSDSLLHQRDRSICLALDKKEVGEQASPSVLLSAWLKEQRKRSTGEAAGELPGAPVAEALRLMLALLPIFAALAGLLSGWAFFSYAGTTPVNVFHFLFLFIFSQFVLALLLLLRLSLNLTGLLKQSFPITFKLYTALGARLADRIRQRIRTSVSGAKRDTYQQILGFAGTVHRKYGLLLYWPLFSLSQRTLVGFNAGLLGASLFRVTTSDLAFGWQSTIQFSSAALHNVVKILALPWSWLFPEDLAYPSLSAIEGSRIILKDGIYHLATENLVSWWPFLLLCLLTYGLLFRVLLTVFASWCQRRALRNINLDNSEGLSVIRRMQTPLVSTQAAVKNNSAPLNNLSQDDTISQHHHEFARVSAPFPLMLLIACDISSQFDLGPFLLFLQQRGFTVEHQETMLQDYPSDQALLQRIKENRPGSKVGIFLLLEAWMPPIGEVFAFIRNLRGTIHDSSPIYIGLVGKPTPDRTFTAPAAQDCAVWKQKLDALSDPYVKIFPYTADDNS